MLLLMLIFSHYLADFVFQTNNLSYNINYIVINSVESKPITRNKTITEKVKSKYTYIHILIHLIVMFIHLGLIYGFNKTAFNSYVGTNILILIFLITIFHYIIDVFIKGMFEIMIKKIKVERLESVSYIVDQLLHILIIVTLYLIVYKNNTNNLIEITKMYQGSGLWSVYFYGIILIFQVYFVGYLVDKIFIDIKTPTQEKECLNNEVTSNKTENKEKNDIDQENSLNPGFLIGALERITMLIFLIVGMFQGVILVLTLKTFSRYKELHEKKFAEKFILGTMISILFSLSIFLLYRLYN